MQVLIGDIQYTNADQSFKAALQQAYDKKERPTCLCSDKHPELYIANIGGELYLKRMPGSGQEHDPECPHYEVSPLLSGRGNFESGAIVHDLASNTTTLKLGFSLSQQLGSKNPTAEDETPSAKPSSNDMVAKSSMRKLNLRGFLDLMYEDAQLNRFYPKMAGKRFWGIIGRELRKATTPLRTAKVSLSKSIFIPSYKKRDAYQENDLEYAMFADRLKPKGKAQPNGFVIGELHSINPEFNRPRLVLRCMNTAIELEAKVADKFNEIYAEELIRNSEDKDSHLIVIARVHNEMSSLVANQIAAMLVDENWIPVAESAVEKMLMDQLYQNDRAFTRVLRYSAGPEQVLASVVLLDTEEPTPIFAVPMLSNDEDSDDDPNPENRFNSIVNNEAPNAVILSPGKPFALPEKRSHTKSTTETTMEEDSDRPF